MKHRISLIFVTLMCCLPANAQTVTDNIYVYRNDGKFNAFMAYEVDSLVYSTRDLKGIDHGVAVVQEIWTPDSVYRIPLSVIDSISVATPEIKYAPKVKNLASDYLPYLVGCDGMTVSLSGDLPHSLRLTRGDILLYEGMSDLFPAGFAGRVETVSSLGNRLEVTCGSVELTDIYDEYVAVGDYMIEEDPADRTRLRAVPVMKGTDIADFRKNFELSLDLGHAVSLSGSALLALNIKAIVRIGGGHTYIELTSKCNVDLDLGIGVDAKIRKTRMAPILGSFPVVFPNIPLLQGMFKFGSFIEASVSGKAEIKGGVTAGGGMRLVYEDGTLRSERLSPNFQPRIEGRIGAEGYIWTGVLFEPSIYVTGHLVDLAWINGIGPYLDFDISFRLDNEKHNTYERVKDSNYSLAVRLGSEIQTSNIFKGHETERIGGTEVDFLKSTFNLLPEFSKPEIETDSKSITAQTVATRDILIPCEVGLRVLDENEKVVETWYSSEQKNISNPELKIGHKFENGLKEGQKYIVRPVVRLWGMEFQASPENECYLDCNVSTGRSYSSVSSFEATGKVETELPEGIETGFCYTTEKKDPTVENAKTCKAQLTDGHSFTGSAGGLAEGTTYYYRAFVHYNDHYYYGDTQCITTKRNIDWSSNDNFGGGYTSDSKPIAETGSNHDVEMKTATIVLTFDKISPSTECGYYLQADSKKGGAMSSKFYSLGTVTGEQTVNLTDLIPGTTYRYWAAGKNSNGKSVAKERTFKTEPSPDPIAKILEIKDIEMTSATVVCYFDNIEEANGCGIEYLDGEFTYRMKTVPDSEGKAEVKLSRLTAETDYKVKPYVTLEEEESPSFDEEITDFTTAEPDVLGWWVFNDGFDRIHDLELRKGGRSNNFYGINSLTWERTGRKIKLLWGSTPPGVTFWEYRGEFDENFTRATGEVFYVNISESLDINEELFKLDSPFYLFKNEAKNNEE